MLKDDFNAQRFRCLIRDMQNEPIHSVLGISRDADLDDIRVAFLSLRALTHPKNTDGVDEVFATINEAYQYYKDVVCLNRTRTSRAKDRKRESGPPRMTQAGADSGGTTHYGEYEYINKDGDTVVVIDD